MNFDKEWQMIKAKVMRVSLFLLFVIFLSTPFIYAKEAKEIKILFIGNSYTHLNNLPGLVTQLGSQSDPAIRITTQAHTPGGCTFERHVKEGNTIKKIQSAKWDYVVLQEQSQMPVLDKKRMHTYARRLHEEISKSGARTVFYMTWARQHKPEMIDGLSKAYLEIGTELAAKVAPVGLAWKEAISRRPDLVLYKEDKSHPQLLGSYLAACVIYKTIFGKDPKRLPVPNSKQISERDARFFQAVASEAVVE